MRKKCSDWDIRDVRPCGTHATLWWRSQSYIVRMSVACVRTREAPVIRPPKIEREQERGRRPMTVYAHTRAALHILGPSFLKKIKIKVTYRPKNCALARGSSLLFRIYISCPGPTFCCLEEVANGQSWLTGNVCEESSFFFFFAKTSSWADAYALDAVQSWPTKRKQRRKKGTSSRCDHTR